MKIYKVLSFVLHLLMILFWSLTALFFLNLSINEGFRLYMQKFLFFSDPSVFFHIGITISCLCFILIVIIYRQNKVYSLNMTSANTKSEVCSSFIKDLVTYFFNKHGISYHELDVVLHRQRMKIFIKSHSICMNGMKKFEKELSDALHYQIGYTKPFNISFEIFEN